MAKSMTEAELKQIVTKILLDVKEKDPALWETFVDTAETQFAELAIDNKDFSDVEIVFRYLEKALWDGHARVSEDACVVGHVTARLAQELAEIGPLKWEVIPDYDAINNENEVAFYLIIVREHDKRIIDTVASSLYWYVVPTSFLSMVNYAELIALRAKDIFR